MISCSLLDYDHRHHVVEHITEYRLFDGGFKMVEFGRVVISAYNTSKQLNISYRQFEICDIEQSEKAIWHFSVLLFDVGAKSNTEDGRKASWGLTTRNNLRLQFVLCCIDILRKKKNRISVKHVGENRKKLQSPSCRTEAETQRRMVWTHYDRLLRKLAETRPRFVKLREKYETAEFL